MFDLQFYLDPIFWAVGFVFLIQVLIYLLLFRKVAAYKPMPLAESFEPVTIVICAKDEDEQLKTNLPLILEQDYPEFEVIVVDDQSYDETADILGAFSLQHPHLKVIAIEPHINEFKGKKLALTLAFKAAKYETLLLTDADCTPQSKQWIKSMQSAFIDKKIEFVLGYSPYKYYGGLLNLLIRYETFYTAMQYISFALSGKPYMGVGRNLSYKKSVFFAKKGFSPYLKIAAGDDDLFVNMHASPKRTKVQLNPESFMLSEPKRTWGEWIRQKRRHISVSKFYKGGDKRRLGMLWLANFLFYIVIAAACFFPTQWIPALGIFSLRMIIQIIIFGIAGKKLNFKYVWLAAPFMDFLFQIIIMPLMGMGSMFSKKSDW